MIKFLKNISQRPDIGFSLGIIAIISMLLIPLPIWLLDGLLAINISLSLIVILVAIYNKETVDFSVFPGLLLIMTLFRLALNASTTRMIIGNKGDAGVMIEAFGDFVAGGNIIVGIIMFAILTIINIKVITSGSTRIAEVAARFTLDAMPGKQMAIDADLSNGIITEAEANDKRDKIRTEADFYGAMDGASKFVKGDATAGLIITFINIIGGISMGVFYDGIDWTKALKVYTIATIGDGLVSAIPALIISTAAGIIVSRAASKEQLGKEFFSQLFWHPTTLFITSGVTFVFALVPGLPFLPFLFITICCLVLGINLKNKHQKKILLEKEMENRRIDLERKGLKDGKEEKVEDFLKVDPLELEIGYNLISIADKDNGGDLLDRITMIRKQYAQEIGIIIPPIRIRDNIQLSPDSYIIKIRGSKKGEGEIFCNQFLALNPEGINDDEIKGVRTQEPTYKLPAKWIEKSEKEKAEIIGLTIIEPAAVLATHIMEVIKAYAHLLLSREDVNYLVDNLKKSQKSLVESLIPGILSLGIVQKVLQSLLKEQIPVRDLSLILEVLSDYASYTKDFETLTEMVRQHLCHVISEKFQDEPGKITTLTLAPKIEQLITEGVKNSSDQGNNFSLPPDVITELIKDLNHKMIMMRNQGHLPILVCSPSIRKFIKRVVDPYLPKLLVLSFAELETDIQINSIASVGV